MLGGAVARHALHPFWHVVCPEPVMWLQLLHTESHGLTIVTVCVGMTSIGVADTLFSTAQDPDAKSSDHHASRYWTAKNPSDDSPTLHTPVSVLVAVQPATAPVVSP